MMRNRFFRTEFGVFFNFYGYFLKLMHLIIFGFFNLNNQIQ